MGFLRFFLATSVLIGHALEPLYGFKFLDARVAVNTFFILSGFYMTLILNNKYSQNVNLFFRNRFLKIFPLYLLSIFLSLIINFSSIKIFYESLVLSSKIFYLFSNIFIFGQELSWIFCFKNLDSECVQSPMWMLNPVTWSLSVELLFYLIAPLIVTQLKRVYLFILLGSLYMLGLNFINLPTDSSFFNPNLSSESLFYFHFGASFIFFGFGSLAYHISKNMYDYKIIIIILLLILDFTTFKMDFWMPFIISMAIIPIFDLTKQSKIDRFFGLLAYPIFLLHFPILDLINKPYFANNTLLNLFPKSLNLLIITCLLSVVVHFTIVQKVETIRDSAFRYKCKINLVPFLYFLISLYFLFPFFTLILLV